ncbi:AAA family ATPase [Cryobacterium zhongshanensis]|uniref:AAA family ATPase n=1 Tax=Cryobacterium zhongshanensis TaxID=2928153 RepID=A0AA41QZB0_9MICO|nr:AAA family ATPase [Cryobacterium zhongshanensis]MCI4659628.1 AAA family ATPase [Cryobacterium zhongshanensis]
MKFNETLTEIIRIDLEIGSVPALMGEPGIGKSSFVEALALAMDTKAFVLPCNQLADKADLTGARLVPTDDGKSWNQVFYPHMVVQQAIEYARLNPREWPVLFFDEINRTTPDVTSAVLTMITLRQLGKEILPENLRIVVAGNDKGNVVALDDASVSRFSIYHVEPEAQTLIAILGAELNPYVKNILVRFPHLVFEKGAPNAILVDGTDDDDDDATKASYSDLLDSGEEMLQLTTPRTIQSISRWLNAVDPTKLQEYLQTQMITNGRETTMLNEVIEAHIGNTEFATHLVAEIATGINSGAAAQIQSLTAPKPNCFASLKLAQSVTDLEDLISGLTLHEKSGSLLYALYEHADNKVIIEQLSQQTPTIEGDHLRLLVQLAAQSMLDDTNVQALFGTTTTVSESTKLMLSAFMP